MVSVSLFFRSLKSLGLFLSFLFILQSSSAVFAAKDGSAVPGKAVPFVSHRERMRNAVLSAERNRDPHEQFEITNSRAWLEQQQQRRQAPLRPSPRRTLLASLSSSSSPAREGSSTPTPRTPVSMARAAALAAAISCPHSSAECPVLGTTVENISEAFQAAFQQYAQNAPSDDGLIHVATPLRLNFTHIMDRDLLLSAIENAIFEIAKQHLLWHNVDNCPVHFDSVIIFTSLPAVDSIPTNEDVVAHMPMLQSATWRASEFHLEVLYMAEDIAKDIAADISGDLAENVPGHYQ